MSGSAYEMVSERILRLPAGKDAPPGYEIRRLLGTYREPWGTGTGWREVYVVVCAPAGSQADKEDK